MFGVRCAYATHIYYSPQTTTETKFRYHIGANVQAIRSESRSTNCGHCGRCQNKRYQPTTTIFGKCTMPNLYRFVAFEIHCNIACSDSYANKTMSWARMQIPMQFGLSITKIVKSSAFSSSKIARHNCFFLRFLCVSLFPGRCICAIAKCVIILFFCVRRWKWEENIKKTAKTGFCVCHK